MVGSQEGLGRVEDISGKSGTGRGTLGKVQDKSGDLGEVRDWSGDPPEGPGRVEYTMGSPRLVKGTSKICGTG